MKPSIIDAYGSAVVSIKAKTNTKLCFVMMRRTQWTQDCFLVYRILKISYFKVDFNSPSVANFILQEVKLVLRWRSQNK